MAQSPSAQGFAHGKQLKKPLTKGSGAYESYAPETVENDHFTGLSPQNLWVALRSSPVALVPVLTRTGKRSFRVTGTIRGKQRKRQFLSQADASAQQDAWEMERLAAAAAMRPKVTRLTHAQIIESEACYELLKGESLSLTEAVKAAIRNPPPILCQLTFAAAYREFLAARKPFISDAQFCNYESPCRRLGVFIGEHTKLLDVSTAQVDKWLTSLGASSKSWNTYRGDLAVVFNWFIAAPRRWIAENPVAALPRFRRRDTLPGLIEIVPCPVAREMMHWLEIHKPNWVACFAIAIFSGIRPDRDDGEMGKLANAIERDGAERYFRGDSLYLTADLTKDGRPRRIPIPDNLKHWLAQYPATPAALRGGTRADYAEIRAKWKIPHDGLRHTSISACAALHGITEAAVRHGNSEKVCRDNYLSLFSVQDAHAFYDIRPQKTEPA